MPLVKVGTHLFERAKRLLVAMLLILWMAVTGTYILKMDVVVYTIVTLIAVVIVLAGILLWEGFWAAGITRQRRNLEECRAIIKEMLEKIPPGQLESEQELSSNTIKEIKGQTTRLHKIIYCDQALRKEKLLWVATEMVYRELRERTRGPQIDGLTVQSLTRKLSMEIDLIMADLNAR